VSEVLPPQVGPYRVERKLGAGGMGTVYLGRHAETGEVAAVKVLPPAMAREPGFVARFSREVDALRKLESPHIVRLFESGVDGETYFYAMEYISGETVTELLRREKRLPWRQVVDYGVQICKALKAAHNAGIVHRDLKPSNLLLDAGGTVKLTDFGVAQVFAGGKLTMTGGVIGTAEYMSPEQAQGHRANKRSDIYSLGAVLYVMLTGRPPFTGQTALDIAQKHRFNQFDSPRRVVPEVPYWLDEIVCKCLEKKPEDRYPDAYVLSLRLQEVPKKVDLAHGSGTFEFSEADATAETMSATSGGAPGEREVGGTLMRDLMKAHVEREHGPVRGLLDNTWVLLGLLALLIAGGFLWNQSRQMTPEERFARGEQLMARPVGPAWDEARLRCFEPLLEQDAETWGPRVAPYLDRIDAADLERRLLGPGVRRNFGKPVSEAERILRQALEQRDRGNVAAAEQALSALLVLLGDDPQFDQERRAAQQFLRDLQESKTAVADDADPHPLLTAALARADALAADGNLTDARALWDGIVRLYASDPAVADEVALARRRLTETSGGNAE
jgi:serine/threonine-protein kinase